MRRYLAMVIGTAPVILVAAFMVLSSCATSNSATEESAAEDPTGGSQSNEGTDAGETDDVDPGTQTRPTDPTSDGVRLGEEVTGSALTVESVSGDKQRWRLVNHSEASLQAAHSHRFWLLTRVVGGIEHAWIRDDQVGYPMSQSQPLGSGESFVLDKAQWLQGAAEGTYKLRSRLFPGKPSPGNTAIYEVQLDLRRDISVSGGLDGHEMFQRISRAYRMGCKEDLYSAVRRTAIGMSSEEFTELGQSAQPLWRVRLLGYVGSFRPDFWPAPNTKGLRGALFESIRQRPWPTVFSAASSWVFNRVNQAIQSSDVTLQKRLSLARHFPYYISESSFRTLISEVGRRNESDKRLEILTTLEHILAVYAEMRATRKQHVAIGAIPRTQYTAGSLCMRAGSATTNCGVARLRDVMKQSLEDLDLSDSTSTEAGGDSKLKLKTKGRSKLPAKKASSERPNSPREAGRSLIECAEFAVSDAAPGELMHSDACRQVRLPRLPAQNVGVNRMSQLRDVVDQETTGEATVEKCVTLTSFELEGTTELMDYSAHKLEYDSSSP